MPNQPGHTLELYYQEAPGVNRVARLNGTNSTINTLYFASARDSKWDCQVPGQPWQNATYDELTYLGTDTPANLWKTQMHCSLDVPTGMINVWFESYRADGSGSSNKTMQIVDWDGSKWNVVVDTPVGTAYSSDKNIGFTLSRI